MSLTNQNCPTTIGDVARPKKASGRGGRRENAGRPALVEDPKRLTIDVEAPQVDLLREIADDRGTSVSVLIRTAIDQYISRTRNRDGR